VYDFDEYKKLGEPGKAEKSGNWLAAIGLQQVDGLKPSAYLIETAKKNIEGDITFDEVKERLNRYYIAKPVKADADDRTEEADKVSAHIAEILSEKTFTFSPVEYTEIHRRLFTGIYNFAGKIRDYNISKAEWVLGGETVYYASANTIRATLDYDFAQEKTFKYKRLSIEQKVEHITSFVSGLWQIHAFGEGNTRATAVFAIKYLRSFGFEVNNDMFAAHSWYFRNALVRANYSEYKRNIAATQEYLDRFFENLLLGGKNILKNRDMHISAGRSDTVNSQSGTVKPPDDTAKRKSDTVSDTVKSGNDTANATVFDLIKSDPRITAAGIAATSGLGIATVKRHIKKLKEGGAIERVGSDKAGHWKVRGGGG
jgi:fido (protein-threonine AMPylation protein)